ncbi:hypothetical protein CERSUDRAFT_111576 [Gelatoporia subvermispora B]|uniref:Uncharacterized protein n=1 Tax=Ceriporiopsis subvermispora (strain B) TaxID=914234 RepID=M2QV85_CERS8|nr:hypothetical protein CERSUDRAFT_111576 [Gelatoporia subvermispora B]
MDVTPAILDAPEDYPLSYDDELSYDDPAPSTTEVLAEPSRPELANRIGNTKVYLLSEITGARVGKRKHVPEDDVEEMDEDIEMDEGIRNNAILLKGPPIAHLPTSNIFAYAIHFDAHPDMALEWIDDTTCILVFPSRTNARAAFKHLAKSAAEEPSLEDGSVTAKPIPIAIWPPEDRINKSLGKGEGLKGPVRMRWATHDDVKRKGARNKSEFYKKYGSKAGKEADREPEDARSQKRSRRDPDIPDKEQLDEELDAFLAEEDVPPPSPPSKMRSDHMGRDGKTLSERMSSIRAHPSTLSQRIMAALPARARSPREGRRREEGGGRSLRDRREPRRRSPRPRKTQEDLDAELDAFLNARD